MSERKVYLVAYDITDKKRLRKVHKKLRGYGDSMQYSVFWCVLSPAERELMISSLIELINTKDDRIMIADLGPKSGWRKDAVRFLGKPLEEVEEGPIIF